MRKLISILAISGALMGISLVSLAEEAITAKDVAKAAVVKEQLTMEDGAINNPRDVREVTKEARRQHRRAQVKSAKK